MISKIFKGADETLDYNDQSLFQDREEAAIRYCEEAAKDSLISPAVLLVFGEAHDFRPYCKSKEYGYEEFFTIYKEEFLLPINYL